MVTEVLLVCAVLVGLWFVAQQMIRPSNYPPGPRWLPIVGNTSLVRQLSRKLGAQHLAFKQLCEEYRSPVLGLKHGSEYLVVVTTHDLVRQVLNSKVFEGRPDNFFTRLRSLGTGKGVSFTDGDFWREQRSFVSRHLRQLGYGKLTMEEKMIDELKEVTEYFLQEKSENGVFLGQCLARSILNVLWALTAGDRFSREDKRLTRMIQLLHARGKAFDVAGGTLNQVPWLRFVAPERTGYNLLRRINQDLKELLTETIDTHKQKYDPNVTNDLIDAFLHEMEANKTQASNFTESQLMMICLDLFIGGSQTTSNTLDFGFLMLLVNPEIQDRVHKEIDAVIGVDRLPALSDQGSLPYTEAVLRELQRLYQVTPILGPRRTLWNTTLHGYNIPKNTTILMSFYSVHTDPEHWSDPLKFRPERFLNDTGELVNDNWLLPFGSGRRRCLAETLAKGCIFLFFTGILQKFRVLPVEGQPLPSTTPVAGITIAPVPYSASLVPRTTPRQQANTTAHYYH